MTQLELAQQAEIEKLTKKLQLMQQLATTNGFYQFYFSQINKYPSNEACFEAVNNLYLELFNQERYRSYDSFRVIHNRKK